MRLSVYKNTNYRYDIQGVRAIGALLIMIYHIWVGKVSGGVDVFFVVSGYFMAGMLIREYLKIGEVKPLRFWARIILRIAPLAYTVIITTIVLAYFFMPAHLWVGSINEALTSALHIENLQLIRVGTDYLASNDPPSPFQQFWALSIQIQFYIVLPFLFIVGLSFSKKRNSIRSLFLTLILFTMGSFCYSIYYTFADSASAYFNPFTRIWEFFVGVLIFLFLPHIKVSERKARLAITLGFLLIISIGIFVPKDIPYPGYIAILPVLAASLMIIGGEYTKSGLIYRILSSKPLVYIGGLSFAIYLWHWPLLVYFQHRTGVNPGDITLGSGITI